MQKTNKNEKKLFLHSERIRTLSDAQLHNVIGGTDRPPPPPTHTFPVPKTMV